MNRGMRSIAVLFVCLLSGISQAYALALGKLDIASHLGETFFAEVPIHLEASESLSGSLVGLASPADYRILEVYRDPALNALLANVKSDSRGARVELSSESTMETPFFNLVLKVRQGHATYFKKYPVFLDLPRAAPVHIKAPPAVSAVKAQPESDITEQPATPVSAPRPQEKETAPAFQPFDGWARTGRYGPMVRGDTVGAVASRLRIDARYTLSQVMMGLFNKNRTKFERDNINLIRKGAYLDVPTAREIEEIRPSEAVKMLARHMRRWREMKKRYAAVDEAQRDSYKPYVRVGKAASGAASSIPEGEKAGAAALKPSTGAHLSAEHEGASAGMAAPGSGSQTRLDALLRENSALQKKMKVDEDRIEALSAKLAGSDIVAANARVRKLELRVARMQSEMDQARQQVQAVHEKGWLVYALAGLIVLLLGAIGYLLRRELPHPAESAPADMAGAGTSVEDATHAFGEMAEQSPMPGEAAGESPDQEDIGTDMRELEKPSGESEPGVAGVEPDEAETESLRTESGEAYASAVDHLAEADVYLRYGMEDEALDQIRMEIKQRPDHANAYCRLVQILRTREDQAGLDEAINAGRSSLDGEGLQAFESAVAALTSEESETDSGDALSSTEMEITDSAIQESGIANDMDDTQDLPVPDAEGVALDLTPPEEEGEQVPEGAVSEENASFDSLHLDKGRSLLAEGMLDEAESAFNAALNEGIRGDALLGLAEIAQRRGDAKGAARLLDEAEPLLDDDNRNWFESIKGRASGPLGLGDS